MPQSGAFRAGVALLAVATVLHALGYVLAQSEHVFDTAWPLHARFHTLQALFWVVGLNATLLLLILGPLRRGTVWPLWPLALGGATAHLSYFLAMALLPAGRPPGMAAHLLLAVLLIAYFAGLWLVARDASRMAAADN